MTFPFCQSGKIKSIYVQVRYCGSKLDVAENWRAKIEPLELSNSIYACHIFTLLSESFPFAVNKQIMQISCLQTSKDIKTEFPRSTNFLERIQALCGLCGPIWQIRMCLNSVFL